MKHSLTILIVLIIASGIFSAFVSDDTKTEPKVKTRVEKLIFLVSTLNAEDIKTLTPSSFEEKTGEILSFSEALVLSKLVKDLKITKQ